MLGWNISVYRLIEECRADPATFASESGTRLATWQTGLGGLDWIDALVSAGHAMELAGNGYPNRYTARASHLIPHLVDGPPEANAVWRYDPHDVIGPGWAGKTVIDSATIGACRSDEWLLVEAWDES